MKISSIKRSENIKKKECGPDRSVSTNKCSSVTFKGIGLQRLSLNSEERG